MLIRTRSGLTYPSGAIARFDPSHPCAGGTILSAVPSGGGNFINLLSGKYGSANSALPLGGLVAKPFLGPSGGFDNTTGTQRITFSGLPAATGTFPATLAGIFSITALHNNVQCVVENAAGALLQLGIFSNTFQLNRWNASNDNTGFTPTIGVPYFLAATTDNSANTTIVWTRLDSGQIQSFTATPASAASSGTVQVDIGNSNNGNAFDGFIGPVMYSSTLNTKAAMLAWAANPWAFWLQQYKLNLFALGSLPAAGGAAVVVPWPLLRGRRVA